jgi:hypothetical protein
MEIIGATGVLTVQGGCNGSFGRMTRRKRPVVSDRRQHRQTFGNRHPHHAEMVSPGFLHPDGLGEGRYDGGVNGGWIAYLDNMPNCYRSVVVDAVVRTRRRTAIVLLNGLPDGLPNGDPP